MNSIHSIVCAGLLGLASTLSPNFAHAQYEVKHDVVAIGAYRSQIGANSFIRTSNNGDWALTNVDNGGQWDVLLTNVNSNTGAVIGEYIIGLPVADEYGYSLIETANGNILIVGDQANIGGANMNNLIMSFNMAGGVLNWAYNFGKNGVTESSRLITRAAGYFPNGNERFIVAGNYNDGVERNIQAYMFEMAGTPNIVWNQYYDESLVATELNSLEVTSLHSSDPARFVLAGTCDETPGGSRSVFVMPIQFNSGLLSSPGFRKYNISTDVTEEISPSIDRDLDTDTYGVSYSQLYPTTNNESIGVMQLDNNFDVNWCGEFKWNDGMDVQRPIRLYVNPREYGNYKIAFHDGVNNANSGRPALFTLKPNGSPVGARYYNIHENNLQYFFKDGNGNYLFQMMRNEALSPEETPIFQTLPNETITGNCSVEYEKVSRRGHANVTEDITHFTDIYVPALNNVALAVNNPVSVATTMCPTMKTGVEEEAIEQGSFAMYPNPSSGNVALEFPQFDGITSVKIYDLAGRIVFNKEIENTFVQLDLSTHISGIYMVEVTQGESKKLEKLIIE